ncbi:unnamed protein product [Mycetohabitans rhizoxinica HKI 454]|uniref:Uncharacterized protein n=2 Tax=Mycetohabitans rhizoxinica TaxID=412963 RepID=E5ANE5_MYCRK|nr:MULTISPECIES: hypothetical protein [Mycetohabitans]MCF7696981.1 hypothetical protein [Mycetohabitans sp. B2]MCG1045891.1 hypothetical protein [Mycetohabitans sp. B6]CBW76398.1 unnamed protein product [Mycetohabitans rhizoxinica HKI 454]
MVEQIILDAFLLLPLMIVAFLFIDELWQEHRLRSHDHAERARPYPSTDRGRDSPQSPAGFGVLLVNDAAPTHRRTARAASHQ